MGTKDVVTASVVLALWAGNVWGAAIILNEYNAVDSNDFLGGGTAAADEKGGRASDSYFGQIMGNGGDWFEMVVIKDHLDIRDWKLDIYEDNVLDKTLALTAHAIWKDLRAGTIITVAEDVPSDISYNPAAGDWWINVQANSDGDGLYIEKSSFPVSSKNWQLRIRDCSERVYLDRRGRVSVRPAVSRGTEIFRLETDPSATVTADSPDYDDGSDFSTFGAPNRWGVQDFGKLRAAMTPAPASLKLIAPNGAELLTANTVTAVCWQSEGITEDVLIEFSIDHGFSWNPVYPPNVGNLGQYIWVVPPLNSTEAQVRVSSTTRPSVSDDSDQPFTIVTGTP
jgi:hypothetical protein